MTRVTRDVRRQAASLGWKQEEPGWWTHPDFGGVCRESDGKWYGWPTRPAWNGIRVGPFARMLTAMCAINGDPLIPPAPLLNSQDPASGGTRGEPR